MRRRAGSSVNAVGTESSSEVLIEEKRVGRKLFFEQRQGVVEDAGVARKDREAELMRQSSTDVRPESPKVGRNGNNGREESKP